MTYTEALTKLSDYSWANWKADVGGNVIPNGVHVNVTHSEWNEILIALAKGERSGIDCG